MADSTLTIKIVSQTGGNPPAKPSAPQAQAPGNAPAGSVQVAPRSSSTTSSATKQQAQAERSLATLAIGMFANQGFNTLTDALGTIPGQSRNAKRLSNIGGGAIAGATAGAMLVPPSAPPQEPSKPSPMKPKKHATHSVRSKTRPK